MAPKPKGYIAAKSIPNELLLQVVVDCAAGRGPRPESALSTWPPKVIGAKLAKLVKRGWIAGPDAITAAGLAVLEGKPC